MADHHVRDLRLTETLDTTYNGNHPRANHILYHFLRTAGWELIWHCDGEVGPHDLNPNHVLDGNMEQSGTANFSVISSGIISKDTTIFKSGTQSLKVVASGAGDGVQTAYFTDIETYQTGIAELGDTLQKGNNQVELDDDDPGELTSSRRMLSGGRIICSGDTMHPGNNGTFKISGRRSIGSNLQYYISYYNPSGVAKIFSGANTMDWIIEHSYAILMWVRCGADWLVEFDNGVSWSTVDTLTDTSGQWELKYYIVYPRTQARIRITKVGAGADTLYIDGINFAWPYFEGAMWAEGTDGALTNPDTFTVGAGDSYTPDIFDPGHHLFIWDPANPKNSGCYEILSYLGGSSLQLDTQSNNVNFTTVAGGLSWRIVDLMEMAFNSEPSESYTAGFGLESPHSTKWRLFLRQDQAGKSNNLKNSQYWGAPADTDFDFSNGHFYPTGPSCMKNKCQTWIRKGDGISGSATGMHVWSGKRDSTTVDFTTRTFVKLAADSKFVALLHMQSDATYAAGFIMGFTSTPDAYHPEIECWGIHGPWESLTSASMLFFDTNRYRIGYDNTVIDSNGNAIKATMFIGGFGTSTTYPQGSSNAIATPWGDSNEWAKPFLIVRDPDGEQGECSWREMDVGFFHGRHNLASFTVFDSDSRLHFFNGIIWGNWNGGQLKT